MRMRRKKHLDERIELSSKYLLFFEPRSVYGRPNKENYPNIDVKAVFGNDNPIYLEIGSGKGSFICQMAQKNPQNNYIAVEKDDNVMVSAMELASSMGLENVKFVICGAEQLDFLFSANSFDGLYLNFSCPFPKGTYANRRLTNPKFLRVYQTLLKNGAKIFQKTDNRPFFEYSLESYKECNLNATDVTFDLYKSEFLDGNVATEYETKFVSIGKPICRAVVVIDKAL